MLPARNSPASMALLASRIYSNTAASASAVFKSSFRLSSKRLARFGSPLHQRFVRALGKLIGLQAQFEIAQAVNRRGCRLQSVEGEIQLLAIRHRGQQVPDGFRLIALGQHIAQGEIVPQRFRHLLAFHHQKLGVQPEARKRFAGERFRLGNLVLVVRKHQVNPSGVNVQRFAQILDCHHGTFNVPARTARTDPGVPRLLAFLGRLPQSEIACVVLFVLVHIHASAGDVAAEIVVRKFAVPGKCADA